MGALWQGETRNDSISRVAGAVMRFHLQAWGGLDPVIEHMWRQWIRTGPSLWVQNLSKIKNVLFEIIHKYEYVPRALKEPDHHDLQMMALEDILPDEALRNCRNFRERFETWVQFGEGLRMEVHVLAAWRDSSTTSS